MGGGGVSGLDSEAMTLRSLPRVFMPEATPNEPIDLPKDEVEKLRKVLRLEQGAAIAVLPNDGTLIRCEFRGKQAIPLSVEMPDTEPRQRVVVAQALPKGDKLETVVRMCTEIGAAGFVFFPAERSIVRWEPEKLADKLRRYRAIAQESAELSFRTRMPEVEAAKSLAEVLERFPDAVVLSEVEGVEPRLLRTGVDTAIVVGPEGGWAPRELALIGSRAVTLGPRVLRAETAAPAACSLLLLQA